MEEDNDDLAAAFFAQQAAKEQKKATLPADDWIKVIEASDSKKAGGRSSRIRLAFTENDATAWLATSLPGMGEYHVVKSNASDGLIGINLDPCEANETWMNITRTVNSTVTLNNDKIRERLKKCLVEKLMERTTYS
ncbi:hypothetical protein ACHAXS_002283 [Conticribra weissflogii]